MDAVEPPRLPLWASDAELEVLNSVGFGVWVFDGRDTRHVNDALAEITGYSREELLQPGFFHTLLRDDYRDLVLERGRARVRGEVVPDTYEVVVVTKDGRERVLTLNARITRLPMGTVSVVSAIDVTPLREAEGTIREGGAIVRALLDALPAHVITTGLDGKPTFVNQHWIEYTGMSQETAMASGTASVIHPDDRETASRRWSQARHTKEGYEIEYRVRDRRGDYRWQTFRILPLRNANDEVVGWISASVDVHDAVELQTRLRDANRELEAANAAKDEILGLVSHELRSPLTALLGFAGMLLTRGETLTVEERQSVAGDLHANARRLQAIIENMLVLSRAGVMDAPELEPVLLERVVERVLDDFRRQHRNRDVGLLVQTNCPIALANRTFLEQVLHNLLTNADKYSPPGSEIGVLIDATADTVTLAVTDRGPGVPLDDMDRLFEPFYRSPAHASTTFGVGLGLTVCERLVSLQGGTIRVARREGGGTVFTVALTSCHFEDEPP